MTEHEQWDDDDYEPGQRRFAPHDDPPPAPSKLRMVARVALIVVVLAAGVGVLRVLIATKREPERKQRVEIGALVDTVSVQFGKENVWVEAAGTVIPARQVTVVPEVGGRLVWLNDELVPGGKLKKGERLARIDSKDYELMVEQQRAQLGRAKLELELERGRKKIAEREWELLDRGREGAEEDSALARREPQLETARVGLESAKSALESAQRNVDKANLKVPFNAVVQSESAEIGQLVGPQTVLAQLVGTDHFWVQVSVPMDSLPWLKIPEINAEKGQGSQVIVSHDIGQTRTERTGRVIRLLGDLDPVGRMARVLVEIDDPFGLKKQENGAAGQQLPLLLGSYVRVRMQGPQLEQVARIPRMALREGDKVYRRTNEGTLAIAPVDIVWREPEAVLVRGGLDEGDVVITSELAAPVEGMKLRLEGETPESQDETPGASNEERTAPTPAAKSSAG